MDINKTTSVIEKKPVMQKIGAVIMVVLVVFIALQALSLITSGVRYVQDFVSDTGTVTVSMLMVVDIVYSSLSEKIQAISICILNLANQALGIVWFLLLWRFFKQITSKNKPFLPGQGKRLQTVAVLMMISALLVAVATPWGFALSAEPMHGVVLVWTFVTTFVGGMLYPLVFFCMALIFNYGMGLQTESDETL